MNLESCKKAAAEKAITFIQDGMVVGIGTGSTTFYFIENLIKQCKAGLNIKAVASSEKTTEIARKGDIPLLDIHTVKSLDIYVDGADEIDPEKRMIKGGGGALVREKIAANMSKERIFIIDESKLVSKLGKRPLPVEIIPFGQAATIHHLECLGYKGALRMKNNAPYVTDNHNLLYDIHLSDTIKPEMAHQQITAVPGVVDTGLFFNLSGKIIIGFLDGKVVVQ
ncbi:MAG TPA: ribose-5-phosphate isomerase RpiA [Rhabdochlamydiaceae bacterium]|jgi:ribose 5-phosphate isomerase A|nr:ribose-5-phosphate isomerase RpiA [Rhabdochlamydiaceae bacterium]